MLATVVWLGVIVSLTLVVIPLGHRHLEASALEALLDSIQQRVDPVAWFSLALLIATGMVQMSANPNYQGFLAFENPWSLAILIKHVVFLGMMAVSAILTWKVLPGLRHNALRRARGLDTPEAARLRRQELLLLRLNLALSLVVLALTALARTA
jgi:uncharacterized membrane protein